MKKISTLLISSLIAIIFSCSSDSDTAVVQIHFGNNGVRQNSISPKDQYADGYPVDAKTIIISVYSGTTKTSDRLFQKTYPKNISTAAIELDPGKERIFVVEAKDAEGRISWRGTSDKVDLEAGETADVTIAMVRIPVPTATLNINLLNDAGTGAFNMNATNLLNNEITVSVFTLNSPIFEQPVELMKIACDSEGDHANNTYTNTDILLDSSITGLSVPANSFVAIVIKGYFDGDATGDAIKDTTWIRYMGAANISETSDLSEGTTVTVNVSMKDGLLDEADLGHPPDETNQDDWIPYNKCQ